ncbi:MAG: hypothetical protein A3F54_04350 [Candidatus Kerfeldbacteria bacterium RIFCSPHIGHO2_12_FULL_48_17]|uniref:DAGKc domain-containing protein n=1 Tax=Candidatus Kerfeldbacteria bacterium RIFCSPHIGHO2_12_FULL_48_17 TaxID=1798542 RepID=A0A1G2B953_9BACT|nr:MAG: hypothetical protein A3F54_04350 [Candidatus Kerfeldbacteria bacterium RIFCSPHIGHO2_12_FULL_48_17]
MKPRLVLIVNPAAGARKTVDADVKKVKNIFQEIFSVRVHKTTRWRNATHYARKHVADGDVVVAAGGDGTLNEVLNGVIDKKDIRLGVLGFGTTNVFAQELGIPKDLEAAARVILRQKTQLFDVGKANDRFFILWCGVGIDAHVIGKVEPWLKKILGPTAFVLTGFIETFSYTPQKLRVRFDGGEIKEGYFAIVSNTKLYGGRLLFPDARFDDGLFNVVLVYKKDVLTFLMNYFRVSNDSKPQWQDAGVFAAKRIEISAEVPVATQVDGELYATTPVNISMHRRKIPIFVP